MKIVHVTSGLVRAAAGVREVVAALSAAQQTFGHDVAVIGLEHPDWANECCEWSGATAYALPVLGPRAFGYAPSMIKMLLEAKPNIVHSHGLWMYPSAANLFWRKSCSAPYLITSHGMLDLWAVRNARWKKRLAGWLYEDVHLRGAACLHALCESEAEAIRAYGLHNPICIIPSGIDKAPNTPVDPPSWQKDISLEKKVLLYLGRLHPKKGLSNLLHAWSMVNQKQHSASNWQLVVAGWNQGGHEDDLKLLARQQYVENSVSFVGPQFEAAKQASYRRADAFILPSLSEGLPMVILEAWAYSLPVLMTPKCNLPEGFQVQAALQIEAEPESIAQGLATLFAMTDEERMAMGQRGQMLVNERFTWSSIATQMLSVYRWVLGQGPMPDCVHTE